MLIRELQQPLTAALQRMIERPEALRPFVVVNVLQQDTFVQFCGSSERLIRFEFVEGDMAILFKPGTPAEVAAAFALSFLTQNLSLDPGLEVRIDENPDPTRAN